MHKIKCAAGCLRILHRLDKLDEAARIAREVTDFLAVLNPRWLGHRDSTFLMSVFNGVPSDAFAVMLQHDPTKPHLALQCLEGGRAVVLGRRTDGEDGTKGLKDLRPELAEEFRQLTGVLRSPTYEATNSLPKNVVNEPTPDNDSRGRNKPLQDYLSCLATIRATKGFEDFLLGPSEQELMACATEGPIFFVNSSHLRSDAVIVSRNRIKTLQLPELCGEEILKWSKKTAWSGSPNDDQALINMELRSYLTWIWKVCVKPILEEAGILNCQCPQKLPRVWWIRSGLASSMPLHAATENFKESSRNNVYSRTISSYVPSLQLLRASRDRILDVQTQSASSPDEDRRRRPGNLLLATMATTPGFGDLDVKAEIGAVRAAAHNRFELNLIKQPSAGKVTAAIEDCGIFHVSCHGEPSRLDPLMSHLVFEKTVESGIRVQDFLSIQHVFQLKLRHAFIAVLSACSTARNEVDPLQDEALHLASGFQAAGFPHVVACLWPSMNDDCVSITGWFYTSLFGPGEENMLDSRRIAEAMRESVVTLRSQKRKRPLEWAQFAHFGA
ncbi:uncharacterized protein J7T54_000025 [Emericellopsis cladophorae]|uniref:CHAT domain-containing protein n=1 Tax=Emericellopsis cladophorae TaxID=2686198 RepID=A0A9Q0B8B9_9HYPO|nr:uncharacterized protein J7T54_000025 [Emericellopsis cladophorae]KAI6777887.1 hypothetical protein J7T54_000025 [Emericellopsis cladophorae]